MKNIKFSFTRTVFDDKGSDRAHYDRYKWTLEQFGRGGPNKNWFYRTYAIKRELLNVNDLRITYYFKNEKDAMMFALRWT